MNFRTPLSTGLLLALAATVAAAQDAPGPYIRLGDDEAGGLRLELATREFLPPKEGGPILRLVSAVHIADASFYAAKQAELDGNALVLFEGVKPAGAGAVDAAAGAEERAKVTRRRLELLVELVEQQHAAAGAYPADLAAFEQGIDRRNRGLHAAVRTDGWGRPFRYARRAAAGEAPEAGVFTSDGPDGKPDAADAAARDDLAAEAVAGKGEEAVDWVLYSKFASVLGLAYQLEHVDTTGPRWRCSDMALDVLHERVAAAGGNLSDLLGFLQGTSAAGKLMQNVLGFLEKNPQSAAYWRIFMVAALSANDGGGPVDTAGDAAGPFANMGATLRVIILDRNAVVLQDLHEVLAAPEPPATVAVFYGAGHMQDMERRVVAELGYRPGRTTWTSAIRTDPKAAGKTQDQARSMIRGFQKMFETTGAKKPAKPKEK